MINLNVDNHSEIISIRLICINNIKQMHHPIEYLNSNTIVLHLHFTESNGSAFEEWGKTEKVEQKFLAPPIACST